MSKNYVVDTSVILDDPTSLINLSDNGENNVYIPYTVLMELNNLKKDKRLSIVVSMAVRLIEENKTILKFTPYIKEVTNSKTIGDLKIIEEVKQLQIEDPIIVTNDKLFRLLCEYHGVHSQEYVASNPFQSESEIYSGFIKEEDEFVNNSFTWMDGKPRFNKENEQRIIDYQNIVWGIKPLNMYQNLAMELLMDDNIPLVSIQSKAGYGKTYISLACALQKVFQEKIYKKIYLVKPNIEIGESLGFLPGNLEEKLNPYVKYMLSLIFKLHNARGSKNSKIFAPESTVGNLKLNLDYFEILPLQYIRGMNIDNSIVIVDECQNLSRMEMRSLLTRMGQRTKCILCGDIDQIDNRYLNKFNNGLNWVVKLLKGQKHYGHIGLKGERSRGPICDIVLKSGL